MTYNIRQCATFFSFFFLHTGLVLQGDSAGFWL